MNKRSVIHFVLFGRSLTHVMCCCFYGQSTGGALPVDRRHCTSWQGALYQSIGVLYQSIGGRCTYSKKDLHYGLEQNILISMNYFKFRIVINNWSHLNNRVFRLLPVTCTPLWAKPHTVGLLTGPLPLKIENFVYCLLVEFSGHDILLHIALDQLLLCFTSVEQTLVTDRKNTHKQTDKELI